MPWEKRAKTAKRDDMKKQKSRKPLRHKALLVHLFCQHMTECVDERCSTENSARKCGIFTYLLDFSLKKVRKTGFIKKSVFLRNRRHFRDAAGRFYELV
ncbi:hypothetical protein [Dysosmobacter sp.]|uniref:hypothetical protein n=1 Tax=Dysosmobacter sp. TaxID=2591382 RepID=UPI003AB890A0